MTTNSTSDAPESPKLPERIWIEPYREGYPVPVEFYAHPVHHGIEYQRVHQQSDGELLSCPFCGAAGFEAPDDTGAICCSNDNCPLSYIAASVKEWNTRAHSPVVDDERAREVLRLVVDGKFNEARALLDKKED